MVAHSVEKLDKILKLANEAVKKSGISDPELKVKAFKFALNYLYQIEHSKK